MRHVPVLAIAGLLAVGSVLVVAQSAARNTPAAGQGGPRATRVATPPIPTPGFAPSRPVDVTRAVYDFAAQHPEVLRYVPCYCGCESSGHPHNESCFVKRRDARGNVLEWDLHGYG